MKRFGALSSSVNPEQLSSTVSGGILMFSGIIILIARQLGFTPVDSDIASFAQHAGVAAGFLWMLFGVIRKVIVHIQQKYF